MEKWSWDWHYTKSEIDRVVSESEKIRDWANYNLKWLKEFIRRDIRIASELAIVHHETELNQIKDLLSKKHSKFDFSKLYMKNPKDAIKIVQLALGVEPVSWYYWEKTFRALIKFQLENEDYKKDNCAVEVNEDCKVKTDNWWKPDWIINWRVLRAIKSMLENWASNEKDQPIKEDLTEDQKKEKLKKMTKNPENYFRWSIEEYQQALLEYNKDPNLKALSQIKVLTHWDLHIEQLILLWDKPELSDFDESYTGWSVTNDLIRILASLKTWWWDESVQDTFLDIYQRSLKWENFPITIPASLLSALKTTETQEDLSNWKNWFINFKDNKFQDWFDKDKGVAIPITHIDDTQKANLQSILNSKKISWTIIDWRIDSSNWVWSFWMTKYVVAVEDWWVKKFYEFKQQSSIHTAKNLDGKTHKNTERKQVAKWLWIYIELTNIDWRDFTISEILPNYNKFPPKDIDLSKDKDSLTYWASCIAKEIAKLHQPKKTEILQALGNSQVINTLKSKANDFSEKNKKSYSDKWWK